jgi:hypothetical protein
MAAETADTALKPLTKSYSIRFDFVVGVPLSAVSESVSVVSGLLFSVWEVWPLKPLTGR